MSRIIWCCIPVTLFTVGLIAVIYYTMESARWVDYWPGVFPGCIALGFLLIWCTRLSRAIRAYKSEQL
jgi:hypothetical protein